MNHLRRSCYLPLVILLALCAGGCTFVNQPLNAFDAPVNERRFNHTHAALLQSSDRIGSTTRPSATDGWFVGLAISGGGSRPGKFFAAAMVGFQALGGVGN